MKLELRAITIRPAIFDKSVMMSSLIPSEKYSCSGVSRHVGERQNGDRCGRYLCGRICHIGFLGIGGSACRLPSPDADRSVDVLDRYLSAVLETNVDAIADAFVDNRGDADPARLGERFEACGNIDAIAVDVVAFDDHVAEIDADPQHDGSVAQRFDPAPGAERCTERAQFTASTTLPNSTMVPSPISFTIAAVVDGNGRIKDGFAVPLQSGQRARLVGPIRRE